MWIYIAPYSTHLTLEALRYGSQFYLQTPVFSTVSVHQTAPPLTVVADI